ncbi:MAG: DUF1080 domain-containing protein [Flavobacteriaceae bacterium]|nr:DUF1080 domain-containing protein [Bacteroidia bacterium]MBT8286579.1 DUF1080 domain-containing protein [Bacteroidia bacterium]NNF75464.1 DUF1080 domain-containing protein [Flavobacteriaceae bacterium]NNK73939.1 DUF1080 domain-containing protein [Flavobacteriaceae bacterium]
MRALSKVGFLFLLATVMLGCKSDKSTQSEPSWVTIFNGKDLDGWLPKVKGYPLNENPLNTFRVKDGALVVSYDGYEDFGESYGHIFYKNPYSSYRLKLQYRFAGEQARGGQSWATKNSGVMIHCQSPESMGVDQSFPVSIEVQLLGGITEGELRPTANLCTPGMHVIMNDSLVTEHCIPSSSETYYGDEWIDLEILAIRDSLFTHFINGEAVMSYSKPIIGGEYNTLEGRDGEAVESGYISLQSESHPIEFKNIEILDLDN